MAGRKAGYFSSARSRSVREKSPRRSSGPGSGEDLLLADVELGGQQLEHLRVDVVLDLQPHRGPTDLASQQLALEGDQQVLGVVLLDLHVLVAGHPEHVVLHHLHPGEQLIEVAGDHVLQRHEPTLVELDEPGQHTRHLDPGELPDAGHRVLDQHGQVDRETGDVRERVRRVHRQRGEHREDALGEQLAHPVLLAVRELVPAQDLDPLRRQLGPDLLLEHPGVLLDQLAGPGQDRLVHLARHQTADRADRHPGRDPALQTGDADHEELVQVVGEDRQELGPLQQRHPLGVLGQLEHPVVERQPGELAVGEAVLGQPLALDLSGVRDRTGAVQEVVRQVGCVHRLSSARRVQVHGSQPDVSAGGAGAAYITSAVTREKPYR